MKSLAKPVRDGGAEGRTGDWGEVVTRYHYRKVGMDHLLSMERRRVLFGFRCSGAEGPNLENRI